MADWILYGSGPSANKWPVPPNVKVACTNASRLLVHRPDLYGIFEINAGMKLHGAANAMARLGTEVYTRPGVKNMFDMVNAIPVGYTFGPEDLHDLHRDVEWGESPVPDYGQRRSWISSGVLLLWIIADVYRPERIYVAGLDGYPLLPTAERDYAAGLPNLGYKHLDLEGYRRRLEMNKRMAEGIQRISNHPRYSSTEFVWLDKPSHYQPEWNVRIAEQSDFSRLYPGYTQ